MPLSHQAQTDTTIENILARANKIGIETEQFVRYMLSCRKFPQQAYRPCLGLIRLVNRYGAKRLNQACKKSLLAGATRYQVVEAMLRNNLEAVMLEPSTNDSTTMQHENIRGAQYYQ